MSWFHPVYVCKLCGNKVVDIISHHSVSDEDLGEGLKNLKAHSNDLEENRLLHTHVDKLGCFGILEIVGFVKREGDDEE